MKNVKPQKAVTKMPSKSGHNISPVESTRVEHASWIGFLEEVDVKRQEIGYTKGWSDPEECYYRGHSDCKKFKLLPGLFRKSYPDKGVNYLKQIEYDLFFEFKARARELHTLSLSSWDVLFAMQHFKMPTRLLDWTEVFGVALYFAIEGWRPGGPSPCIWMLNPYALNLQGHRGIRDLIAPRLLLVEDKMSRKDIEADYEQILLRWNGVASNDSSRDPWQGVGWEKPCAIYPDLKNSRIHAQHGSFTIHGEDELPLEQQLPKDQSILRRVDLPEAAIPAARKFLLQAGIDSQLLFPDLEGLATSLKEKYKLK